jgi:hypothetical protein
MTNDPNSIIGMEFDWFAVDEVGHIGHFATAGFGPIPAGVLENLEAARELGRLMLQLPVAGEATGHLPGDITDWLKMARRGLFSYDWESGKRPAYLRTATPSQPIRVSDLPEDVAARFQHIRFSTIRFAELTAVRPEQLGL